MKGSTAIIVILAAVGVALYLLFQNNNVNADTADTAAVTPLAGVQQFAEAITSAEGSNATYNNPGDLAVGDVGYGTFGAGITIFGTAQDGLNALWNQLNLIVSGQSKLYSLGMTIQQMANIWVNGPNGGETQASDNWATLVAGYFGVTPSTALQDIPFSSPSQNAPSESIPADLSDQIDESSYVYASSGDE